MNQKETVATGTNISVHNWILTFQMGETRLIPQNLTYKEILEYGLTRFEYSFAKEGDKVRRICSFCRR
jgi:hypothetical protein